ncbi:MAG: hypothetical protein QNJ08_14540, partial [Crocosphaera sp.]|nr:hypothetical protein [Crocosphaera sp.]
MTNPTKENCLIKTPPPTNIPAKTTVKLQEKTQATNPEIRKETVQVMVNAITPRMLPTNEKVTPNNP